MGDSFTIQISNNLVQQLAKEGEKSNKRTRKPKTKPRPETHRSSNKVHQKKQGLDDSGTVTVPGWPLQPPVFFPVYPPAESYNAELDAIQSTLKESEKVVERLQKHEDDILQEVTSRAKELHENELKLPNKKPIPCLAEKVACLECYKEHSKDPLKCATSVKNFADCVRRFRQQCGS